MPFSISFIANIARKRPELKRDKTNAANPDFTNAVKAHALERNLILLTCGVYGNVIRFLAPITIQDDVFAEALDIIEASIRAARADVSA